MTYTCNCFHHISWLENEEATRVILYAFPLADPGGAAGARPPKCPDFFVLTQIFRNVAASGVGAPPTGNPGSATVFIHILFVHVIRFS